MIRAIVVSCAVMAASFTLTYYHVGYERAGQTYVEAKKKVRAYIRPGTGAGSEYPAPRGWESDLRTPR